MLNQAGKHNESNAKISKQYSCFERGRVAIHFSPRAIVNYIDDNFIVQALSV